MAFVRCHRARNDRVATEAWRRDDSPRATGRRVLPAPAYSLAQAAWIPRTMIRHDDGTCWRRREGEPRESWAEAMRASWRLGRVEPATLA